MFESSGATREDRLAAARAALTEVQGRIGTEREGGQRAALPLAATVSGLLPGGLRRGTIASIAGSTSLVLALAGEASREGSWIAMVGMPHVGVVAAARRGVDLARLALVPHPGAQAAAAVAACIDGMDVVILGERLALSDADCRRLSARVRERGTVLLSVGAGGAGTAWPGARIEMVVESARWSGLGAGDGRLRDREVVVAVRERGGPARHIAVVLDGESGVWRPGVRGITDGVVLADEVA